MNKTLCSCEDAESVESCTAAPDQSFLRLSVWPVVLPLIYKLLTFSNVACQTVMLSESEQTDELNLSRNYGEKRQKNN